MNVDSFIKKYSSGEISKTTLQEETELSFSDILGRLTALNLKLPRVDTYARYNNDKQRAIYDAFFGIEQGAKNE